MMMNVIFDDLRKGVLGLLFVVAFGWTAALVLPGGDKVVRTWDQTATSEPAVPLA